MTDTGIDASNCLDLVLDELFVGLTVEFNVWSTMERETNRVISDACREVVRGERATIDDVLARSVAFQDAEFPWVKRLAISNKQRDK